MQTEDTAGILLRLLTLFTTLFGDLGAVRPSSEIARLSGQPPSKGGQEVSALGEHVVAEKKQDGGGHGPD